MSYSATYTRVNWKNYTDTSTPLNANNLNNMDLTIYKHDQALASNDTSITSLTSQMSSKANQSDLLTCLSGVTYNTQTGVFLFTWKNGTSLTVDLNIEKIPVSFSMSEQGIITMTTTDGTQYTADVGSLIKMYSFVDSNTVDFTVTTDPDGNKTVTADIIDGSITGAKLESNFLVNCQTAQSAAETAQGLAEDASEDSEAWAKGTRENIPVSVTDPTYNNNSKYYCELAADYAQQADPTRFANMSDVNFTNLQEGQVPVYNSVTQMWENGQGGSSDVDFVGLYGKTEISSDNLDLDNYTTIGNYYNVSYRCTNTPFYMSQAIPFNLTVKKIGNNSSTTLIQIFECYRALYSSSTNLYIRYYYNDSWNSWNELPSLSQLNGYHSLWGGTILYNTDNLNNCTSIGNYVKSGTTYIVTGSPSELINTDIFMLWVFNIGSSSGTSSPKFQLLHSQSLDGTMNVYIRGRQDSSSSWSNWTKLSGGGTATDITYDNTDSGLTATNIQDAVDEIVDMIGDVETLLSEL